VLGAVNDFSIDFSFLDIYILRSVHCMQAQEQEKLSRTLYREIATRR